MSYGQILRNRIFLSYLSCILCAYGGLFTFLAGSSAAIVDFMGYSADEFGVLFALTFSSPVLTQLIGGRLVGKFSIDRLLFIGVCIACIGGLSMGLLAGLNIIHVLALVIPMAIFMIGFGLILPMCMAAAMSPFPQMAGAASSVMGFLQFTMASATMGCLGLFQDGTQIPMAVFMAVFGAASLGCYVSFVRRVKVSVANVH